MIVRKRNERSESKEKWLLTFTDMITLLLAFFVVIISMSHLETGKIQSVAASARGVLAPAKVRQPPFFPRQQSVSEGLEEEKRESLSSLLTRLEGVSALPLQNGFALSLNERLLFPSGSAEILDKGVSLLQTLGEVLQSTDVDIRVEGNTDDMPVATERYPSNWDLSLARAVNVVKCLINRAGIEPARLSVAGYADTKPRAPNNDSHNRQLNRRVDVILTFPGNMR